MKIEIRIATVADAISLAPRLKKADLDEVRASTTHSVEEALTESVIVSDSDMVWCATIDGVPEIIWGVRGLTLKVGGVWLLSSDRILDIKKRFMVESVYYVKLMHDRYPTLTNFVDARNEISIGWLQALGFQVGEPVPYGHTQIPFRQITSEV